MEVSIRVSTMATRHCRSSFPTSSCPRVLVLEVSFQVSMFRCFDSSLSHPPLHLDFGLGLFFRWCVICTSHLRMVQSVVQFKFCNQWPSYFAVEGHAPIPLPLLHRKVSDCAHCNRLPSFLWHYQQIPYPTGLPLASMRFRRCATYSECRLHHIEVIRLLPKAQAPLTQTSNSAMTVQPNREPRPNDQ
jgi:hypothetical protein